MKQYYPVKCQIKLIQIETLNEKMLVIIIIGSKLFINDKRISFLYIEISQSIQRLSQ